MMFGNRVFPRSWSHQDFQHVLADVMGFEAREVWH
ncbi:MAG: phosphoribosylformylglycinamidine synthase I, partial [candidate division NC10 bacterium]|nr:phosphoribosylformylglycinamidine synthase I [candidate division NC10 bacterium]